MRFLVSFKSNDKAVKPKRDQVIVSAPSDELAFEYKGAPRLFVLTENKQAL